MIDTFITILLVVLTFFLLCYLFINITVAIVDYRRGVKTEGKRLFSAIIVKTAKENRKKKASGKWVQSNTTQYENSWYGDPTEIKKETVGWR